MLCLSPAVHAQDGMARPVEDLSRFALQNSLDHVWTMTAAGLVFFMQVGFLMLESGLVRSKNSINVAQKNIADFIISTMLFGLVGFMIMFGTSVNGLFGFDPGLFAFDTTSDWTFTFFVFQLVFCGTAATIVSGAAAERTKVTAYMLVALFMGCFLYPVFGHWAWGNLLNPDNTAWLADLGFVDFAGSTVVHSIGAWAALAVVIMVGPRQGRFGEDGKPREISGHDATMATAGAIILWIGWIGFNGGSTTAGTPAFAHIIANTVIAGAAGGITEMLLGRRLEGLFRPERSINGVLAGLVAITAGCDLVTVWGAVMIGALGAAVAYFAGRFMVNTLRLDDAIGAIPVHGVAGAWGTMALAVFAPAEALPTGSHLSQLGVQGLGVAIAFVWGLGLTYAFLKVINAFRLGGEEPGIRVSDEAEAMGLNAAEHGASLGTGILQASMQELADGKADLSKRISIEVGNDASELAYLFNRIMENMEADQYRMQKIARQKAELEQAQSEERQRREEASLQEQLASQQRQREVREGMVEKFRQGLDDITVQMVQSVSSLDDLADGMVNAAAQSSLEAQEAGRIVTEANEHIQEVVQTILTLADLSASIEKQVTASDAASHQATDRLSGTNAVMARLEKSSHNIGEVVKMISEIAQQTNMLALNATIEASRAGDQGRGFGVVAEEVKKLASQTANAAAQVTEQIADIQSATLEASDGLAGVRDQLSGLSQASKEITAAILEQSSALDQIVQTSRASAEKNAHATSLMGKLTSAGVATSTASQDVKKSAEVLLGQADAITRNSEKMVDDLVEQSA
jgi:Amt family ammonium transporter